MASFPEPAWFLALGRLMEAEGALFQRLGYAEMRFVLRVIPDHEGNGGETLVGIATDGYRMTAASIVDDLAAFDPDFVICAKRSVWDRMLTEITESGRPSLRHTLSSLALVGDEMWLESTDQLREDKFYRFNQTLQEILNLASHLPATMR
jgi:hypothetical protein